MRDVNTSKGYSWNKEAWMRMAIILDTLVPKLRHRWRALITMAGAMLFATSIQAAGQCYKAISINNSSGKEMPIPAVCTALAESLNEFCDEPPMVCTLKISPKYPKLSLPKWTEMDVKKNMGLIEKLQRGSVSYFDPPVNQQTGDRQWAELRTHIEKYQPQGKAKLSRAYFDILNRGQKESVYKVDTGYCEDANFGEIRNQPPWKEAFANMSKNSPEMPYGQVDTLVFLGRHAEIFQSPEWRAREKLELGMEAFPGATNFPTTATVFLYEGRSFAYEFSGRNARITGFNADPVAAKEYYEHVPPRAKDPLWISTVCAIKYLGSEKQSTGK